MTLGANMKTLGAPKQVYYDKDDDKEAFFILSADSYSHFFEYYSGRKLRKTNIRLD
jgi:hypothetical protein